MKKYFTALLLVFLINFGFGQKGIHKFGNIPMEEMEMTVYDEDSSAVAVKLLKTGQYLVRDYKFYVHERIKILKEAGKDYANFTINAPSKGSFKASTFNLENGEIVEYKLKKVEIFEEQVAEDLVVYKLFLPNVKVGSVVEIEYEYPGLPNEWRFQELIPVKYCELLVQKSQYFIFEVIQSGVEDLKWHGGYHWSRFDMPAFKSEPLMDDMSNYIRKVEFQFSKITLPGQIERHFSTNWEKVGENLNKNSYFGKLLKSGTSYLNEKGNELKESSLSDEEKIAEAYKYIQENIEWNEENSVYASLNYRKNFKENHSGNVADVNLHLISLLKKSGLSAYPVVLSTKDNGRLNQYKASINKLNYVVCNVLYGDKSILLDATDKNIIPGVLPIRCLNGDGWIFDEEGGRWIDLNPRKITLERSFAQIELKEDGECTATILRNYDQYKYHEWMEEYETFQDDAKYTRAIESQLDDMYVDNFTTKVSKDKMKVSVKYSIDMTDAIEDLGDEIILDPFLFSKNLTNPFNEDTRFSDIDLEYKSATVATIVIKVPDGVVLHTPIEPITVETEDQKVQFTLAMNVSGNLISINYQMAYNTPSIRNEQYSQFKAFYSLMIDKLNESITLKRT